MGASQKASVSTQTAKQQQITPTDPFLLTPATRGVISNNRETWPAAFVNIRSDTFLTATKFHGIDSAGLAKFSGPGQPVQVADIGIRDLPAAKQREIAADLAKKIERAPLMLQNMYSGGQYVTSVCEVVSGNPNAIKVRPLPGFDFKAEKVAFMDAKTWEKAMEGLEKDIAAAPLSKAPKIALGQKSGDWLDSSLNLSIVQTIDYLKTKGYPYQMGGKADLDGAMDCSGFVSAMMRRVGRNMDESVGQKLFDRIPQGTAADMVSSAMKNGGNMSVQELLKNPRPGCMIGLDTGDHGWDRGRPNGIDHVAMTFKDRGGKMMVAEYTPSKSGGSGLKVSELNDFVNRYAKRGQIYVASPEGMCNKSVLAAIDAKHVADLGHAQAAAQPQAVAEVAEAEYIPPGMSPS